MKTLSQWDSFCSEDAPNVLDLLSRKIAHSFVGRMCFVFLIQKEVVYLPGSTRAAFVFFLSLEKSNWTSNQRLMDFLSPNNKYQVILRALYFVSVI